jgi:hypothetical protein
MRTLLALTVALLIGCSTGDPIAIAGYPAAYRDAVCSYLVKCGEVDSVASCRRINVGLDVHLSASQLAAIEAGKVVFDGGNAKRCLDALSARSCDATSESNRLVPDACLAIVVGTLRGGADCAFDDECVSRDCDVPACTGGCCQGKCIGDTAPARAKVGDSCQAAACEPSAYCDRDAMTCVALKSSGVICLDATECKYGLDCDSASATCLPLPAPGEPCAGACRDDGTTCNPLSRTCVMVALGGAACDSSADCSRFYRCDASKRCSAGVGLGEPCSASLRCADDRVFCEIPDGQSMGSCVAPRADGQPCKRDSNCDSRSCDQLTGTCRPEPVCI